MTRAAIEKRLAVMEQQLADLQRKIGEYAPPKRATWDDIVGTFAGDPIYKEAMRLGAQYRQSLRPKPRRRKARR